eukprot:CAMPEP_0114983764 /NCGR_PEP_ID=MMETSP0216-20121206/6884_1 /TAXON_ID=223996 /ORGANISM="Protocruzia adherens, Strain Boccale" /LENGTH=640 /DNA_ID=CAMNT_0002345789 /DNA_START=294 /DNA_END=2216 /DNA_ORIENTATION=-
MKRATTYEEWYASAIKLDAICGHNTWKATKESEYYDYEYIEKTTSLLKDCLENKNAKKLMLNLRCELTRNKGGINHPILHQHAYVGTKELIEAYNQKIIDSLRMISQASDEELTSQKKLEFFSETRHVYGRSALLLSGGGTLGLYHAGIIKTLYEQKLLPRVIAGSSAGSIVASIVATHTMQEMPKIFDRGYIKYGKFEKKSNALSAVRKIYRILTKGVLMDVSIVRTMLQSNLGNITFQEAYDKTGFILNITVTSYGKHEDACLLNYLTAPNVVIWSAALASCAIPFIYSPVELLAKDEKGELVPFHSQEVKFVDGSIGLDLPMARLSELFNINTFIVSQTNPWVVPFLTPDDGGGSLGSIYPYKMVKLIKHLIHSEIRHRCLQMTKIGILPKALAQILNMFVQDYRGHVTIWPVPEARDFLYIMANPDEETMVKFTKRGARRAFRKVSYLRALLGVEQTLDQEYSQLKKQLHSRGRRSSNYSDYVMVSRDVPNSPQRKKEKKHPTGALEGFSLALAQTSDPLKSLKTIPITSSNDSATEISARSEKLSSLSSAQQSSFGVISGSGEPEEEETDETSSSKKILNQSMKRTISFAIPRTRTYNSLNHVHRSQGTSEGLNTSGSIGEEPIDEEELLHSQTQ